MSGGWSVFTGAAPNSSQRFEGGAVIFSVAASIFSQTFDKNVDFGRPLAQFISDSVPYFT